MPNLIVIKVFFAKHDAQMAQGLLKDSGIEAIVSADDAGGFRHHLTLGMGNVRLLVQESDVERAKDVLRILEEEVDPAEVNELEAMAVRSSLKDEEIRVPVQKENNLPIVILPVMIVLFAVFYVVKEKGQHPDHTGEYSGPSSFCQEVSTNGTTYSVCRGFYQNGNVRWIGDFTDQKSNGSFKKFFYNGGLEADLAYQDGKIEGNYKVYFENGQLRWGGFYKEDKLEGETNEYYESGRLKRVAHYKNDEPDGSLKAYYESGVLMEDVLYREGKRLKADGQPFDGVDKTYFENGQTWEEWNTQNGLLQGISREYFPNGQINWETMYRNNKPHGVSKKYYPDGTLKSVVRYHNNVPVDVKEYDEKGSLIFQAEY